MRDLTVEDVLGASAEYDHAIEIRSVGPAVVLVLERDAPLRMETVASTEQEFAALLDEVASNPRWAELLELFDALRSEDEGMVEADLWRAADEHAERLQRGKRIDNLRVSP